MRIGIPIPFTSAKYWCPHHDDVRIGRMNLWIGAQRSKRVTIWPWGRMYEIFIGLAPRFPK